MPRLRPGQIGPAWLYGRTGGGACPTNQGSLTWACQCFLCFLTCPSLLVAALAGVTVGTSASAVVHRASIKSRIASLLMGFSWLAARPQVASVIAGATRVEQVEQNVRAIGWNLSAEEMAEIDTITKGYARSVCDLEPGIHLLDLNHE